MKRIALANAVGAAVLALSLAAAPSMAQTGGTGSSDTTTGQTTTTRADDGFDWGWLGLLGLIGLAGLAGKNKHSHTDEPTRYRDPNEVGSSGSSTNRF